ncbi:MAG: AhpC/TSA family protein [Bacteroidales bacterium]|nr:AhpC/TSA family protein [Bacteroidales bacterium]
MNRRLKRVLSVLLLGVMLWSCKQGDVFKVEGTIDGAEGDTLFLEHRGLAGIVALDSVVLKGDGSFSLKQPAPVNPEFYQLRIGNQVAAFAVDSAETLRVSAEAANLYHTFAVKDSPSNDRVRQVDSFTLKAASAIDDLEKRHDAKAIDDMAFLEELDSLLSNYKEQASRVILGNPAGAAAYYAVFQKLNDYLIFDPYSKQDYAMFGAVATSWSRYYPDTERTKHLYDFTMNALRTRRQQEQQASLLENIPIEEGTGLPDIVLRDVSGNRVALSSLKGKVVLLDFVVYNADFSPAHNIRLNELYSRYRNRGLEIYQISLDSDEHFWKTSASNLPWITVRDPQSVNSALLATYNVRQIPTAFFIDGEGDIVARVEDYQQLASEIEKVL